MSRRGRERRASANVERARVAAGRARRAERRGVLLAFGVFGVFWGAWSAVLPAVQAEFGLDDGQLGFALAAIAVSAVPVMPVAGRLVDRWGTQRVLPACLGAFALVLALFGVVGGTGSLLIWLLLLGAATGALDVVANAGAATWERVERDRLLSVAHGAFSVGVLVGSAGAGLARELGAGPVAIVFVVGVLVLAVGSTQPAYRRSLADGRERAGRRLPRLLVLVGLLTAGAFFIEDALQSWSALHLERGLGATPAVSGLGPGLYAGAMAAGRLAGGALSRRFEEARLLAAFSCLLGLCITVTVLARSPAVALVGLTLAGAGTSVLAPVLYSAVGSRAPAGREGSDLAAVTALGYIGFVAGPPSVGVLSGAFSLPVALGALGLVAAAMAVCGPLVLRGSSSAPEGRR